MRLTINNRYLFNVAVADLTHGLIKILIGMSCDDFGGRQLFDHHQVHQLTLENYAHEVLHRDNPRKFPLRVDQREIGMMGLFDETGKLAERHMFRNRLHLTNHDVADL